MRKFSSYGIINKKNNYYAPRNQLIAQVLNQLINDSEEDGHYITIWVLR